MKNAGITGACASSLERGLLALAANDDVPAAVVEVAVPQRVGVPHLEGAPLSRNEAWFELMSTRTPGLPEPMVPHEAAHAGVNGQRQQRRLVGGDGHQVVVHQR